MGVDAASLLQDNRVTQQTATLNGQTYQYLLGLPKNNNVKATIFLIHGWPDISMGWRNQMPLLLDLGYRVVCPDMMGYGGTDAPQVPPNSVNLYTFKRAADDMVELARQHGLTQVILGGHDWGGAVVYRIALWYPGVVTHLFSVCTPYWAPTEKYTSVEKLVESGKLPNLAYQLQLASGTVEKQIQSKEQLRQFLNGMYGGLSPDNEAGFDVRHGVNFEVLPRLRQTRLVDEATLDYYADQYAKNGMHGTLNWYRTREQNFKDELALEKTSVDIPVLFIQAAKDGALPPSMSVGMDMHVPKLTKKTVDTDHWALWQAPEHVNALIKAWLEDVNPGVKSSL